MISSTLIHRVVRSTLSDYNIADGYPDLQESIANVIADELDPTNAILTGLRARLVLLPSWHVSRHGGELIRLQDALNLIRSLEGDHSGT